MAASCRAADDLRWLISRDGVANAFRAALERADDHTVADRMGEHEEMDELLAEMRSLTPDGFAFTQRGAFTPRGRRPLQREEGSVFANMRAPFSVDELAELGGQALAVKQRTLAASCRRPAPRH